MLYCRATVVRGGQGETEGEGGEGETFKKH